VTQLVKINVVAEKLNVTVENVQQLVRSPDTSSSPFPVNYGDLASAAKHSINTYAQKPDPARTAKVTKREKYRST